MYVVAKSTLLGLGLAAAIAVTAQAQAVSALPPSAGAVSGQSAITQPYGSTQSYFPRPGGGEALKQEPPAQTATAGGDPRFAPYSVKNFGPKPQ